MHAECPPCPHVLKVSALECHQLRVADATAQGGHNKFEHYTGVHDSLTGDSYGPAVSLEEVRPTALWQPLTQVQAVAKRKGTSTNNCRSCSASATHAPAGTAALI